jgi:hypothetical protein
VKPFESRMMTAMVCLNLFATSTILLRVGLDWRALAPCVYASLWFVARRMEK